MSYFIIRIYFILQLIDFFTFYTRPHKLVSFYHYRVKTLLQKEESSSTKPVHDVTRFTSPRQTCFTASALLPCMGWLRVMLSNQKSVFTQLVATWFVARQAWKWEVKQPTSLLNSAIFRKQVARADVLTTHMANLPTFIFILLFIVFWGAESSMIKVLLFGIQIEIPVI